jgi:hypothetical protein
MMVKLNEEEETMVNLENEIPTEDLEYKDVAQTLTRICQR